MKHIFKTLLIFIISILFITTVKADCTYKERNNMLNESKKVDIWFEPNIQKTYENVQDQGTGEIYSIETNTYFYNLNITNIPEDLYLKITNNYNEEELILTKDDLVDGKYIKLVENETNIIKYTIEFYSLNESCYAKKINTKYVIKPIRNDMINYEICNNELTINNKYCKEYITENFDKTESEIFNILSNIIDLNEDKETNNTFTNLVKTYWYIPSSILLFIIVLFIIILIKKKRSELK